MPFVITYRDPRRPDLAGATIVSSEPQVHEAVERLARDGFEVTLITPPQKATIMYPPAP
jgi:hypothetical protein